MVNTVYEKKNNNKNNYNILFHFLINQKLESGKKNQNLKNENVKPHILSCH